MSIFTDPVTVTVTAGDLIFSFRGQQLDAKAFIGEWIESTASVDPALESKVTVKHTETGTLNRRLLQRKVKLAPLSGESARRPLTINKTYTYDDNITQAELQAENEILIALEEETGYYDRLCAGQI